MPDRNIVLCLPAAPRHLNQIQRCCGNNQVILSSQDEIPSKILDADIFFGHAKVPVDWDKVVASKRLRWIQSSAAGLDHCLVPAVVDSDIPVTGCSGLFAQQVTEQTFAILFGLIRNMNSFHDAQQRRQYKRLPTDILYDKTVGIVGFGGNGRRIAKALQPLAQRIIATDCFPDFHPSNSVEVRSSEDLDWLLSNSNVVIVTLPLSAQNEGLLGVDAFEAMQKDSYFINVGRGSVVDHDALCAAVGAGKLKGVGLDVADPEPIPADHPIWSLENVIITPHVGAQSPYRVDSSTMLFCENLKRFNSNEPLLNLVDKKLGFPVPDNRLTESRLNEFSIKVRESH